MRRIPLGTLALTATLAFSSGALAEPASFTRVTAQSTTSAVNNQSFEYRMSDDGSVVTYDSAASNLVSGDTNSTTDIFFWDRASNTTSRYMPGGRQLNGFASKPRISGDGRYLLFFSIANNILAPSSSPPTDNYDGDFYLLDRNTGVTTRVSTNHMADEQANAALSNNGRYVAWAYNSGKLVRWDRTTGLETDLNSDTSVSLTVNGVADDGTVLISTNDALEGSDTNGWFDLYVVSTPDTFVRVSLADDESEADAGIDAYSGAMSADGRYVVFNSGSTNLVTGDTNGVVDVFLRDRTAGTTVRVSVSSTGAQLNGDSSLETLSSNGRFVVFDSAATDQGEESNSKQDSFVYDSQSGHSTLLTPRTSTSFDAQGGPISSDGRYAVVVGHDLTAARQLYPVFQLRDTQAGTFSPITTGIANGEPNADSMSVAISPDGRYVAFESEASNLVSSDTNFQSDVFLYDSATGSLGRVSVKEDGSQTSGASSSPTLGANAACVGFVSTGSDLVSGDTNGALDAFIKDLPAGTLSRVNVSSAGAQDDGEAQALRVTPDCRFAAFVSTGSTLVTSPTLTQGNPYLFRRDRNTSTTVLVSVNNSAGGSTVDGSPSISADGRWIAFATWDSDYVAGDNNSAEDIYVRDVQSSTTTRVSVSSGGGDSDNGSRSPSISPDGKYVAFESEAANLVAGDTNGESDVFVRDVAGGTTTLISKGVGGVPSNGSSSSPSFTSDGRYVVFLSTASNLVSGDTNGSTDVFMYDTQTQTIHRESAKSTGEQLSRSYFYGAPVSAGPGQTAFSVSDTALVPNDYNTYSDIVYASNDGCPFDSSKTSPGVCGCGVADTDSDGDSVADCIDECTSDPQKSAAGACGCGTADTDSDGDGVVDCSDLCSTDALKTAPGSCGCGVSDTDADHNGVPDCNDPKTSTIPTAPVVTVKKKKVTITMQQFAGATYQLTLSNPKRSITSKKPVYAVTLRSGSYKVSYKVHFGKLLTKSSPAKSFKVK